MSRSRAFVILAALLLACTGVVGIAWQARTAGPPAETWTLTSGFVPTVRRRNRGRRRPDRRRRP
jgi:hypothetical protein